MIVLDASAAIDLLLGEGQAAVIAQALSREGEEVAAPHLLDAEVGQVLRRLSARGAITSERAEAALADLADLPLLRFSHVPLSRRAFQLRADVTFYDALYLALAEELGATLMTSDAALATVPGLRARVQVVNSGSSFSAPP